VRVCVYKERPAGVKAQGAEDRGRGKREVGGSGVWEKEGGRGMEAEGREEGDGEDAGEQWEKDSADRSRQPHHFPGPVIVTILCKV